MSASTGAQPVQNDALLSTIINDYVNSKFARGKGMAYVGMKLDHLERATLHLQVRLFNCSPPAP